jgi:putative (di)nucleoside polyphosphate hydrolase
MMSVLKHELPYRLCVGAMLVNAMGQVFVAKRIDSQGDYWQMPQGGIDEGEDPVKAVLRELEEETGTGKAEIIAKSDRWRTYDLPDELIGRLWSGKYRGQRQKWFALKFLGEDKDINLVAHETPEFSDWKWVKINELVNLVVPFKKALYGDIVTELKPFVGS